MLRLVALIYSLTQKSAKMEIDGLLQMPTPELGLRNFKKRWVRIQRLEQRVLFSMRHIYGKTWALWLFMVRS